MIEYAVVIGISLAALAILIVFLHTFGEYGTRIIDLVGAEYP